MGRYIRTAWGTDADVVALLEVVAETVDVRVPIPELKCSDAIGAGDRIAIVCQHKLEVI